MAVCSAQTYTIITAAGGADPYFLSGTGDGGLATSAALGNPTYDVAVDGAGNLYIAAGGLIRKVTPGGTISTVAGGGQELGENVPALQAALSPTAIIVDSAGDILIADTAFGQYRVRKVDTTGTITTIAGGAPCCALGDGGPATSAYLEVPYALALDGGGNLYIAQVAEGISLVRVVGANGTFNTVAGGGACCAVGDGGSATAISLMRPLGVAVDKTGNNVYIADAGANRVRKVSGGIITTVAGTGAASTSGDGGNAMQAGVDQPWHVAVDSSGNLFITEFYDARVRMVTPGGTITTIAGDGVAGYSGDGGPGSSAELDQPAGIVVGGAGIYIADDNPAAPRVRLLTVPITPVQITVTTSPVGLSATLDTGSPCTTPCLFILNPGSMHTIAVSSPQLLGATQYAFSSWSDGGAISHSITVPSVATTYTANFVVVTNTPPSLSITKTHSGNFNPGQNGATYTVTVTNAANTAPTSGAVTVTENLPSGMTLVSMVGAGWNCLGSSCTRSNALKGGNSYPAITVTVNVAANATSPQLNAVSVSGGGSLNAYTTDSTTITSAGMTPGLVWQNDTTRQVTVWYMGGAGGTVFQGYNYLSAAGVPGWHVVAVADFNGDGVPDLVWQNDSTRQVTVWYMGGAGGAVLQGYNFLSAAGVPGWHVVAVADFNGDGVPDLVWQNDSTRQVTVWYMGGAGGAVFQGYSFLSAAGVPGWHVAAAADFNGDGVPDLVWQNDGTRQVTVWYMGGAGGAVFQGYNYLSAAGVPGWHVVAAVDQDGDGVPDLVWLNDSTRQVTVWYMGGAVGAVFQSYNFLSAAGVPGWSALN